MKKCVYLTLALVLTAAVLAGCGCTNRNMGNPSEPTILPTNEEVWDTTTTRGTTQATIPSMTTSPTETLDRGNGPLEDPTISTETTAPSQTTESASARSGGILPNKR